ncbi:M23 family metallopeptidase [Candidatus Peregrinibacteria bacterium]|nr:M23 family metallopeptidase [Candidatus Peregrinibacteria bacterium]
MNRIITTTEAVTLTVNTFARRNRHLKIFSKGYVLKTHFVEAALYLLRPIAKVFQTPALLSFGRFLSLIKARLLHLLPTSPQKRLLFQAVSISAAAIVLTSLSPGGTFTAASMTYSTEYMDAYAISGNVLVADSDGYLVKINPQTDAASRVGLTDYAVHTVESGESLSVIAERYDLKIETIAWENNITNGNKLRIGQKLMVPPVDGVSYKIKSGDSLEKIAKKYEITAEAIIAQNSLESEMLAKGETLFLPGATPIYPVAPAIAGDYRVPAITRSDRSYAASSNVPAIGKIFIFPTTGKITQGYHGGHYAYDIADRSKPPIWAAGGGTVIKASSGTWGGGYGNHVIIDHGNGVQTLYGHMDSLNVYEGQWVSQGDVIGVMGNTGRVYGATGIHVHWEVIVNGVKMNPGSYY